MERRDFGSTGPKSLRLLNRCPHQAAPLCHGAVKGMAMPSKPGE